MPRAACTLCGGRGRHTLACERYRFGRRGRPPKEAYSLAWARDWFERFGLKPDCISPNGRKRFAWLLGEVERLQKLLREP